MWREGLSIAPQHKHDTTVVWRYTDRFFGDEGYAAVTRRRPKGGGEVIYLATGVDPDALVRLAEDSLHLQGAAHVGAATDPRLEQMYRVDNKGKKWLVTINHGDVPLGSGRGRNLPPYGVDIVEKHEILL